MKIHQLSLFLENHPGRLKAACKVLGDAGIDIVTLALADTEQFGILRLIVADWQRARSALEAAGTVVNVTEVIAIEVGDHPGGLLAVLDVLDGAGLAIEYMYAFAAGPQTQKATLVFRFEDPDAAVRVLARHGVNVVGSAALLQRVEP
jgi:hypothetical protein